ncbi:hypothetical protein [Pseudomonas citri]|uniref:hypothetical protein n=1 Tax=Pseudomonas citri TaxID=2978349 RepID=UPI0021B61905|nr:hypothetical protein [Pseudomonas citri]
MAQRGYLGIHAEVPTAQYLRSAIVVDGAQDQDQDQDQDQKRSGLVAAVLSGSTSLQRCGLLWEQSLLAMAVDQLHTR